MVQQDYSKGWSAFQETDFPVEDRLGHLDELVFTVMIKIRNSRCQSLSLSLRWGSLFLVLLCVAPFAMAGGLDADLAITQVDFPDPVVVGGALSYTLNVFNAGPDDATTVTVVDTLPVGVTFVSATGTGWACGEAAGLVTCTLATLPSGTTASAITIALTAPWTTGTITNVAMVSAAEPDPMSGDDSTSEMTTVVGGLAIPTLSFWGTLLLVGFLSLFAIRRIHLN